MATQLPSGMVPRIKNILLTPTAEWDRIDAEPMTEKGIFTGWVLPLAAIGPVAGLIGGQLLGVSFLGITYRPPLITALVGAVLGYVLTVVGIWLFAKVIDALAPTFNGTKNPVAATKVAAFSATASFVVGIFGIIPMLGFLSLLGLYSLFLLYRGLPKLMKAPADKAVGYTVVTCLCMIVIYVVIGAITAALMATVGGSMLPTGAAMSGGTVTGNVNIPGVGNVDMAKLDAASKNMEASAASISNGTVTAVPATKLAELLPQSAAGWTRTEVESASAGAGGIGGSNAKGKYTLGDDSATLEVTDMAAMGALAAMGGALNIEQSKTTATGYEKTGKIDGRLTTEEWDTTERQGKYSTIVADRFMIEVRGNAASIDALKGLAASIDMGTLAAMK